MNLKISEYEISFGEQQNLLAHADALFPLGNLWRELKAQGALRKTKFIFIGQGSSLTVARWAELLFCSYGFEAESLSSMEVLLRMKVNKASFSGCFPVMISQRGNQDLSQLVMNSFTSGGVLMKAVSGTEKKHFLNLSVCNKEKSKAYTFSVTSSLIHIWFLAHCLRCSSESEWLKTFALKQKVLQKDLAPYFSSFQERLVWPVVKGIPFLPPWSAFHVVVAPSLLPIGQEIALKLQETAYIPALCHGIEDFLHGPLCCVEPGNHVLFLRDSSVDAILKHRFRQAVAACRILKTITIQGPEARSGTEGFLKNTLANLFFGQRLALEYCHQRGTNPDTNRTDDTLFERALRKIRNPIPPGV